MGNVWRVFRRDVVRLIKTPSALVVVVALLVLPSVYTWYNVIGFWNPYDNTGNMRVSVVNEDEGGETTLTGELHIGDMIVDKLAENDQLDWVFQDREEAMSSLYAGETYAVFVIPSNFTENLLTLTTGDFVQPELEYYVNEKTGPVAPKITDTGATTLEETINSTFVSTISDVAAEAIDGVSDKISTDTGEASSYAATQLNEASQTLSDAHVSLASVKDKIAEAQSKVEGVKETLSSASGAIDDTAGMLSDISTLTSDAQSQLNQFSAKAAPQISESIAGISQTSSQLNEAAAQLSGSAYAAQGKVDAAISRTQALIDSSETCISVLQEAADKLEDGSAEKDSIEQIIASLEQKRQAAQTSLDALKDAKQDVEDTISSLTKATDAFNSALQLTMQNTQSSMNSLFGTTIPAVTSALSDLSSTAHALSGAVSNQKLLISQTNLVLDQLTSTLSSSKDALTQTDDLLVDITDDFESIQTDVIALGTSDTLTQLFGTDDLDASKIADFMASPTELVTEKLYELNAYGSAMAPLFMNLTFWIGAFMLLVIMKQEVDDEGIKKLTVTQRYWGRFLLFAILAVGQALICCAGVLVIGVQAANVPALFVAASVASLAYLSIIYALSLTLQHIGKGICVLLVFAQIPGATGLYPIEMTPPFFQAIYPYFPFTYGINAMREAICGFYGTQYASALAALLAFFVAFSALGVIVRPLAANLNRMVATQVRQSGLYNGETVEIPSRPYRFSQIFRAIADKEEYRRRIIYRHERFDRWYPRLIKGGTFVGLLVPILIATVFTLTNTEKVILLSVMLVWIIAVFIFLVTVECIRASINRQMTLDGITPESIVEIGVGRNKMVHTDIDASAKGGERDE